MRLLASINSPVRLAREPASFESFSRSVKSKFSLFQPGLDKAFTHLLCPSPCGPPSAPPLRLTAQYVTRYFDSFMEDSKLHIVMEFCSQGTLHQLLQASELSVPSRPPAAARALHRRSAERRASSSHPPAPLPPRSVAGHPRGGVTPKTLTVCALRRAAACLLPFSARRGMAFSFPRRTRGASSS